MTICVPPAFAESIRRHRLLTLSVLALACFIISLLGIESFAYAGLVPVALILIVMWTYNKPLWYRLSPRAVYLTTDPSILAIPISIAISFWTAWPFDRVVSVTHTHFDELPALLILTNHNRRGFILPVERADAEQAALYLEPAESARGANAIS
jgi:hypothetical protein